MSSQQNLHDLTEFRQGLPCILEHLVIVDAGDTSAVDTNKVRVQFGPRVGLIAKLESPDMVAQFRSRYQACLGQIRQVSVYGCLVKPERNQVFCNFRMCRRRFCILQPSHDRHSRTGHPQADLRQKCASRSNCFSVLFWCHVLLPFILDLSFSLSSNAWTS